MAPCVTIHRTLRSGPLLHHATCLKTLPVQRHTQIHVPGRPLRSFPASAAHEEAPRWLSGLLAGLLATSCAVTPSGLAVRDSAYPLGTGRFSVEALPIDRGVQCMSHKLQSLAKHPSHVTLPLPRFSTPAVGRSKTMASKDLQFQNPHAPPPFLPQPLTLPCPKFSMFSSHSRSDCLLHPSHPRAVEVPGS